MTDTKYYLTKEGLEKIEKKYESLNEIKLAKTKGETPQILESEDLNPEYLTLQEDIGLLQAEIEDLKEVIKNAEIIKLPSKKERDKVHLGAMVYVELDGEVDEFKIVGTKEADPTENKISDESPIGRALMGKKTGDSVVVKTQLINHTCKIKKIKYKNS